MIEQIILATFGLLRLDVLIRMIVPSVPLWLESELPVGSLVMLVIAVLWSVFMFVDVLRRGSFAASPIWLCVVDVAVAAACLVMMGIALPQDWRVGTWHAWPFPYGLLVAPTVPAWVRSRVVSIGLGVGLGGLYVAVVLPGNWAITSTVIVNGLQFVTLATVTAIVVPIARRFARVADRDRATAVELATQLEQAKYHFHIHNVTGLLAQLSQDDTPDEIVPFLRKQAAQESNRLRHDLLDSPDEVSGSSGVTLDKVVDMSLAGFEQLPIEVRTALGRGVLLNEAETVALQSALISLLYNVQFHADAHEVVVHTDSGDDFWEVSVADDGIGFDPERTPYGFGLQRQVLDSARDNGMSVEITSAPGEGTCVVIRGRRQGSLT